MSILDLSRELSGLVKRLGPSVVMVDGGHRRGASGLVWSADGVIVTAAHKVVRDDDLRVGLGEAEPVAATLVGHDAATDVAVLRVEAADLTPPAWTPLDAVEVGQLALAIARPGRSARAALGVITTLGRESWTAPSGGSIARYIETDIGGRPGYSGGALVDAEGRVIGMSTGGLVRGASLAVPHATLERVVASILTRGRVGRGWLGVGAYPVELPAKLAEATGQPVGLMLVQVAADGPGDRAGLLIGDVLVSIDGTPLPHVRALQAALVEGAELSVKLVRAGQVETRTVRAGGRG